jgi:hypothetical protein
MISGCRDHSRKKGISAPRVIAEPSATPPQWGFQKPRSHSRTAAITSSMAFRWSCIERPTTATNSVEWRKLGRSRWR